MNGSGNPVQNAILITLPEEIDDQLWDEIDEAYDDLSEQYQQLLQSLLDGQRLSHGGYGI